MRCDGKEVSSICFALLRFLPPFKLRPSFQVSRNSPHLLYFPCFWRLVMTTTGCRRFLLSVHRHEDSEHLLLRFHTEYSKSKVCNSIFDFSASISQLASRISLLASMILGIRFLSFSDFSASILSIQVLIFSQGASPISQVTSEKLRFYLHSACILLLSIFDFTYILTVSISLLIYWLSCFIAANMDHIEAINLHSIICNL